MASLRTLADLGTALTLMISLAACGGSATGPKACDVLTLDGAKKLLGPSATLSRSAQPNVMETQCQYRSANGTLTLMTGSWAGIESMKSSDDKPLTGLGDEASEGFTGVTVRKGVIGMNVSMILMSGDFWGKAADSEEARTHAAEEKVAAELVTRL
jgi:hypothetical protein